MTTEATRPAPAASTRPPMSELIWLAAMLISGAREQGLATPELVTVMRSRFGPQLSLQYPDTPHTARDLIRWANFFGAVVTSEPRTRGDGQAAVHCTVCFEHQGTSVQLYAYLTTPAAPAA
jgi:hypothetical protein